jgi:hypothetical protein
VATLVVALAIPSLAAAQREVHWQLNPQGFPAQVSAFVDVEDQGAFRRDLPASAFALSMDEFAGDQGGWIMNQQQVAAGWAGAQVLVMIDRSRSYTGEFDKAKKMARAIVNNVDPSRDQAAIAEFPTSGGFSESKLIQPFTSDKGALSAAIGSIKLPPKDDKTGARICEALAEGLRYFPETTSDKYRVVIFLSGGADKGEGKGDCVKESYNTGLVPFFSMIFKLDRKYDDPRNAHKIENKAHELSQKTGGRSIFRRAESELAQFVGLLWNRIRSQYQLQVNFPCYRPAPHIDHTSMLKVEGRDTEGIKFQAVSTPAPVPQISALYPQQAYRTHVDDKKVDLTIDGQGFCGGPGQVKVSIGGRQVNVKSQNPFRLVTGLHEGIDSGKVTVYNRFGQNGESAMRFEVIKPPKGAEASKTLMILVFVLVGLAVLAVLIVVIRSRRAKVPKAPPPLSDPGGGTGAAPAAPQSPAGAAAKTVAITALSRAWVEQADGSTVELKDGANVIGREPHCAIQLTVQGVSREHAKIEVQQGTGMVLAEDLGSTNGTYWGPAGATEANLQKLEKRKLLTSGDTIWIGGQKLSVFFEGGSGAGGEG